MGMSIPPYMLDFVGEMEERFVTRKRQGHYYRAT
jgi:hypothetical protein